MTRGKNQTKPRKPSVHKLYVKQRAVPTISNIFVGDQMGNLMNIFFLFYRLFNPMYLSHVLFFFSYSL